MSDNKYIDAEIEKKSYPQSKRMPKFGCSFQTESVEITAHVALDERGEPTVLVRQDMDMTAIFRDIAKLFSK